MASKESDIAHYERLIEEERVQAERARRLYQNASNSGDENAYRARVELAESNIARYYEQLEYLRTL